MNLFGVHSNGVHGNVRQATGAKQRGGGARKYVQPAFDTHLQILKVRKHLKLFVISSITFDVVRLSTSGLLLVLGRQHS